MCLASKQLQMSARVAHLNECVERSKEEFSVVCIKKGRKPVGCDNGGAVGLQP